MEGGRSVLITLTYVFEYSTEYSDDIDIVLLY